MFIPTIAFFLFSLLALTLPVLAHPVDDQPLPQLWNSPEALSALAIINDPTPKFLANITFTNKETLQNVTAQASYICDTTFASPSVHWIREVSGQLRGRSKDLACLQSNPNGGKCTKLLGLGDAAVSICGEVNRWVKCDTAGFAGFWISDHCAWKGLAGGRLFFDDVPKTRIAVHKN